MPSATGRRRRQRGFTLIELLVVIAIVALLVALLLPTLAGARSRAQQAICLNNLRQYGTANHVYLNDFKQYLPPLMYDANGTMWGWHNWGLVLDYYLGRRYSGGSYPNWSTTHYSNGPTVIPGSVHACPSEPYLNGTPTTQLVAYPEGQGVGQGYGAVTLPGSYARRFYFTSYAYNAYVSSNASTDQISTSSGLIANVNYCAPTQRLDDKRYPGSLWLFTESYGDGYTMQVYPNGLNRNVYYVKVNFERHRGSLNVVCLDGHAQAYLLNGSSWPGIVENVPNASYTTSLVKQYRHWGWRNRTTNW